MDILFNNVPLGLVAYESEPWAESDVIKMKKNKLACCSQHTTACMAEALQGELKTAKMLHSSPLETQNCKIFIKKGVFFPHL